MKVCFLQTEWDNQKLLNTLRKMTPNRSGKWKDMEATTNIKEADFYVVIDYTIHDIDTTRAIYLGAHPTTCGGYVSFDGIDAFAKRDLKNSFGYGEWWLDEDYDALSAMEPPRKCKNLSCILTNNRTYDYHRRRIEFMVEFCEKHPFEVDLYGRIKPQVGEESLNRSLMGVLGADTSEENYYDRYWFGKRMALESYRYSLEFDMGSSPDWGICKNYFSERFFDSLLMWCCPIYYGGIDIHRYIPENSFRYIDPFKDKPEDVIEIAKSDFREENIGYLAEARNLLLNDFQIWPYVYSIIRGK